MAKKIVILGAGISGLSTAWFLKQRKDLNAEVVILEKSPKVGGWIQTVHQDGFLFEQGPRSFRTQSLALPTWQLIEQLGLKDQIILSHVDANTRYLYHKKKLEPLPKNFWNVPFSAVTSGWLKALMREYFTSKSSNSDESIYDFFSRRITPEWAERLVDPLVSGIFAGNMRKLSIKSCFPMLYELEQRHGSLLKGAMQQHKGKEQQGKIPINAPLFSFKSGMQTLTQALFQRLERDIFFDTSVKQLVLHPDRVQIELVNSEWIEADRLISCIPTYELSQLLAGKHPFFATDLNKLNYASVMVVNLGYWKPVLKQTGYGYLIPSQENESILGCVWDSTVFPQQNPTDEATRLTVMLGGAHHADVEQWSQEKAIALALSSLEKHLQIQEIPNSISVKTAYRSIPQYEVGYQMWLEHIQEQLDFISPSLICLGSAFNGVSVNECIMGAYQTVEKLKN